MYPKWYKDAASLKVCVKDYCNECKKRNDMSSCIHRPSFITVKGGLVKIVCWKSL